MQLWRGVVLAVVLGLLAPASAGAASSSLPAVGSGARPGPDILYAPPAESPQLENAGVWQAPPILVSGASAYHDGEFLYQDYLYDDHGARGSGRDPHDPRASIDAFSLPSGTYTYPTAPAYAGNAADLVELRVKPLADATAFRITLNTLLEPSLVAATIAIGTSPTPRQLPFGANASAPAQLFLTVHGTSAELTDAGTGAAVGAGTVAIDSERRQIEVRVPHAAWDPGTAVVRLAAGLGLWDSGAGRYLLPQTSADASHPGGGTLAKPAAFFNVAFRFAETVPKPDFNALFDPAWWRDNAQGHALAVNDLTPFFANVDFGKLDAGADDEMAGQRGGVPQAGPIDRILVSDFETAQGTDYSRTCTTSDGFDPSCKGELRGRLQPYAIYVPSKPEPGSGRGLTLLLHSFNGNYNQFLGTRNMSQFGERGPGSIVITPEARGPAGWYFAYAGADVFEVWADVARRYRLDPARTTIAGYSMGGYGTWKLAGQFPDLFARAQPTVGPTVIGDPRGVLAGTNTVGLLPSLRHVPVLDWLAIGDASVPFSIARQNADELDRLEYRYELDAFDRFNFVSPDHFVLAFNDEWGPPADFLDDATSIRNPAHVTYAYDPAMDFPEAGTVAGHAYWLSGVRLRSTAGNPPLGSVDVFSHGLGAGDPPVGATERGTGAITTGNLLRPAPYTFQRRTWGATPAAPSSDTIDIRATNVASVTIDPRRARVSCRPKLNIVSDGPLDVTFAGCRGNGKHKGLFKK